MGKNYSDNWHSIKNTEDLTMKQMFDISEKLISEQSDEIYGLKQSPGKILHGIIHLLLVMKKSSVFNVQKSTYFKFCIMPWKDEREPTIKYSMGRQIDVVQKFNGTQNFG